MYRHFFKRLIDILLSLLGIIVLLLPMIIIAIIIKLDSKGPVFFKQKRVGLNKNNFSILKFRSMPVTAPKDVATHKLSTETVKLSKFQTAIRKYSIDELPQLFNIFVGQMSIVGPRPALWNQFDLIEERDKYNANSIRPGLTGWAQVNGRDELEIDVKAKLDGEYVEMLQKNGFITDLKCFWLTIKSVIKHDGVVEGGTGEMKKEKEREKVTK